MKVLAYLFYNQKMKMNNDILMNFLVQNEILQNISLENNLT